MLGLGISGKFEKAFYPSYPLDIKQPALLGHSHGGAIAIKFDQFYPEVAKSIVLISAPLCFWDIMCALCHNCAARYEQSQQHLALTELASIYTKISWHSLVPKEEVSGYIAAAFTHGLQCGLYNVQQPTPEARALFKLIKDNPITDPLSESLRAVLGFMANEDYINIKFTGICSSEPIQVLWNLWH